MTYTVITRATYERLPRVNQAVALLMEEAGQIRIVGDENSKTHGETS